MRRLLRTAAVLGLVVVSTLAGSEGRRAEARPLAVASAPGLRLGLHQDLMYDGWRWRRARHIDAARDVGATISRTSFLWDVVEPRRGRRDWSRSDAVVSELARAGIEPLFVVVGSPAWANGVPAGTSGARYHVPTSEPAFRRWLARYAEFVRAAAKRYRGKVRKWEIWNEPNERFMWKPRPSATRYARLYTTLRRVIHEEDPSAQVAVGGLSGLVVGCCISGRTFLSRLIAAGAEIDHVAIHPYSEDRGPDTRLRWESNFADIAAVRSLLVAKGEADAELWVTEWGWQSSAIGPEAQSAFVRRSLELLRERYPYVKVATYFVDVDRPPAYRQGLFDERFAPKPAAAAFREVARSLPSARPGR